MSCMVFSFCRNYFIGGEDAEIYRNRKEFFSINVQAICDSDTIFNDSNIKARFDAGEMRNCILLGMPV
jgi:hypothetical protein